MEATEARPPVQIPVFRDNADRSAWIRSELKKQDPPLTLSALSKKHGEPRFNLACQALAKPLIKWQSIIAFELGVKPQDLFPERYGRYGEPIRGGHKKK